MKFFELAKCLRPSVPGGLARAPYMRELISMFTTVTETEWGQRNDPSALPSDSTLESMCSRDSAFTVKLAQAICSRLDTTPFIRNMDELSLDTQELIMNELKAFDVEIDLADFAYEITALLVQILHEKARRTDRTEALLKQARIESIKVKHEKYLILRAQGCASCGTQLFITSHGVSRDSFNIVFLNEDGEINEDNFAVTCKPCAEKFNLRHTSEDIKQLREHNDALAAQQEIQTNLAPLGLDKQIVSLLSVINDLPLDYSPTATNYNVVPLQQKLREKDLLRYCKDAMATYEQVIRTAAKSLEQEGKLDYQQMRHQIKSAWFVMRKKSLSQFDIWERLTAWVHEKTQVDRYACGIVIAYLIQICDVFEPLEVATA